MSRSDCRPQFPLTRKQHWRRTRSEEGVCQKRSSATARKKGSNSSPFSHISSSDSDLSSAMFSSTESPGPDFGRRWGTVSDLCEMEELAEKKKVNFNPRVNVVLIPSSSEYEEAGLRACLWWSREEFNSFKRSARRELEFFIRLQDTVDSGTALRMLYQPS